MWPLLLPCLALAVGAAVPQQPPALDFEAYCAAFGKNYSGDERARRKAVYDERLAEHARLNARATATWVAGPNAMTDLFPEEMRRFFGYAGRAGGEEAAGDVLMEAMSEDSVPLPESVDWRQRAPEIVPRVRDQGACGSCWAFAAVAAIESAVAKATGTMLNLSQQQLTSCTANPRKCGGDGGCAGATAALAFNYTKHHGLASDAAAPYKSGTTLVTEACQSLDDYSPSAGIKGFVQLPLNNALALMRASARHGLITVSVDASFWWLYAGGVFDECSKANPIPNHAVTLVGYGQDHGTKYWLILNSWGTTFGEQGYIRLRRYDEEPCGVNTDPRQNTGCEGGPAEVEVCGECGVLSDSSYPVGAFLAADGGSRRLRGGLFV